MCRNDSSRLGERRRISVPCAAGGVQSGGDGPASVEPAARRSIAQDRRNSAVDISIVSWMATGEAIHRTPASSFGAPQAARWCTNVGGMGRRI